MRNTDRTDPGRTFAVVDAALFDGDDLVPATPDTTVTVVDGVVVGVGGPPPPDATIVDGRGATLLPGLIDAHTHPDDAGLVQAARFGVTTVVEMGGAPRSSADRSRIAGDDSMADLRSAGPPLTAMCGHPNELFVPVDQLVDADGTCHPEMAPFPGLADPDDVAAFVADRVGEGSDFIKLLAEEGSVLGAPGLPQLDASVFAAAVREAHRHGLIAVAHALTLDAARSMVGVGVDGLAHIFLDRPADDEIVAAIAGADVFVVPCLSLNRSITGTSGADLAADPRVAAQLDPAWATALRGSVGTCPTADYRWSHDTVAALHRAGVPILAGTDSALPHEVFGGLAQGASLHHELQLLVAAGLTPLEALRAATSLPARHFGLADRGVVRPGARADLLLVDGDPVAEIGDTLSIRAVWRRGAPVPRRP